MPGKESVRVTLFSHTLPLIFSDEGTGQTTFLLLHGGAGPASMAGLGTMLSQQARVATPTHPGFNGEPRPDWFTRIDDLVLAYLALIEQLQLSNVVVVGNSVGGWIAAEMALRQSPQVAGIVLLNAVGIDGGSPGRAIVDPMALAPAERAAYSFHDPARFALAPAGPEAAKVMADNQATLRAYAGQPFTHHPALRARLAQVSVPALVVWGRATASSTWATSSSTPRASRERTSSGCPGPVTSRRSSGQRRSRGSSAVLPAALNDECQRASVRARTSFPVCSSCSLLINRVAPICLHASTLKVRAGSQAAHR